MSVILTTQEAAQIERALRAAVKLAATHGSELQLRSLELAHQMIANKPVQGEGHSRSEQANDRFMEFIAADCVVHGCD